MAASASCWRSTSGSPSARRSSSEPRASRRLWPRGEASARNERRAPLPEQAREAPVLEDAAARLAARAVVDRVLLEVDLRERGAADVAGLAEPPVDAVGPLVGGAGLAQLQPALELGVDGGCEPRHFFLVEVARERVGRQLRRVEDLVRPGPANARDQVRVAQQRMQSPRLAVDDLAEPLRPEAERLRPEVRELGLGRLGREQPDAGALLPCVLREDELRAALELDRERRRLRASLAPLEEFEPPRRHQVDEEHEPAVVGREEEALAAPLGAAEATALERVERRVERLQRGDVRRPRTRDGERRDRVVQLTPPRLHLRKLGHAARLVASSLLVDRSRRPG